MKVLVLGGTKFLGRAIVDAALERGHELTLFNRGTTNPDLFPQVEKLRGDRHGDLSALRGREWDAAVDPSGYVPRVVRASAELLRDAVEHYTFVSSVSAYATPYRPGFDETAPLAELEDAASEDVQQHYGALKTACERVVEELFPGRAFHVRAGLIVGPHDPTDRFTYWPVRIALGGDVLCPAPPERQVQFVDVRDLADWVVRAIERRLAGAFTATGPVPPVTFAGLVDACVQATGSDARPVWVDDAFLVEQGVGAWLELPLWIPASDSDFAHMQEANVSRAAGEGLAFRPVADTARDTLAWVRDREAPAAGTAAMGPADNVGLSPAREAEVLAKWRARAGG